MPEINRIANRPVPQSASGAALSGSGSIVSILCTASSSAVLNIYDGTDNTGTKIVDSLALVAGTNYPLGYIVTKGVYVELASGSGKWTVGLGE